MASHATDPASPQDAGPPQPPPPADVASDVPTVITSKNGSSIPSMPAGSGSPAEVAAVLLGHHLDHFELQTLIGGGGMGAVFRARDTRLDRTVALKVIPRVGEDPELQRRFRNEAQSAARLDHPNIARVYDVGRHAGWHYIVFEYIEGTNLRDLVHRDGLLSVDDAVFYTRQVAEALEHASRRGVTHRDIKPSNVLITSGGQVKLVDMGLARAQQLDVTDDMTASGVTLGTFDYISPEQAKDPRDADVRSDIYSLGCTLYFALTGRPPYEGGTVLQKLLSHGASPPPDPRNIRGDLSDNLVAILHKMLAKQPHERYRRPADLISDLYQLAKREQLPRALSAGAITVVEENRFSVLMERHLPWLVAVSIVLISTAWLQLLSSAESDLPLSEQIPASSPTVSMESGDPSNLGATEAAEANSGDTPAGMEATAAGGSSGQSAGANPSDPTTRPNFGELGSSASNLSDNDRSGSDTDAVASDDDSGQGVIRSTVRVVTDLADEQPDALRDRVVLVDSLSEALRLANEDSGITVVEIGPGVVRSGPVEWPQRAGLAPPLTLRGMAADSVLEFVSSTSGEERSGPMIDLGKASIDISSLHLLYRIPEAASDGGSLFGLAGGNTIRLEKSTISISNPFEYDNVFAFESTWQTASPLAEIAPSARPPLIAVQLRDAIVRGEASVLGLRQATLVQFRWDNGLLAVTGNMLRVGAARQRSLNSKLPVLLVMNEVTAVTMKSVVQLQGTIEASDALIVDREANHCVFSLPGSVPIMDVANFLPESVLELRGDSNYYDATDGRTKVVVAGSNALGDAVIVSTSELLSSTRPSWIKEVSPTGVVVWRNAEEPLTPGFTSRPSDYMTDGVILPGFRSEDLPVLPDFEANPDPSQFDN